MKKLLLSFYILIILILSFSSTILSQGKDTKFLNYSIYTNKESYTPTETLKTAVVLKIKPQYHINSYKTDDEGYIKTVVEVNSQDWNLSNIYYPPDTVYTFKSTGTTIRTYIGEIVIGADISPKRKLPPGIYKLPVTITYQACDDKTCLPPETITQETEITISEINTEKTINSQVFNKIDYSGFFKPDSSDKSKEESFQTKDTQLQYKDEDRVSNLFEEKGFIIALIFIFLGGLALNLTPCVYPLIPITISYFGAQSKGNKFQKILIGIFYALGMSITYSVLGVLAALTGQIFGAALQNPIVIVIISLIFVTLATSMFGLFEIRIPQKIALAGNKNRPGYGGAIFMGLLVGFIAAPCIGPFVLSLLVYVGSKGDAFLGFLLFFVLSMGLGFPYIILASSSTLISKLPRSGEWMEGIKVIFGFILIGLAIYTLEPLIPKEFFKYLFPGYIIFSGVYLILIDRKGVSSRGFTKFKYIAAILAIVYGTYNIKPEQKAELYIWSELKTVQEIRNSIKSENKPVIIDFTAVWCSQCKELEKYTYTDEKVIELSKSFNNIKVDLTSGGEEIWREFDIKGLPTVIFLNSDGTEYKELKVTGFVEPEEFLKIMNTALDKGKTK
ncbi:MAG: hypothetical protein FJ216_01105 [Ignavibacteria bacterium]|nr:hypothetical protein [Ignavibacteria bacterium]